MAEEMSDNVPKEQRAGWSQFLKSIATFSGDLSSLTAPSFILSPVSLVEFPAYWGEHPELFAKVKEGRDDVERLANVLRWFIATLKGQYTARNTSMGSEKKPLNPILGELFLGKWPDTKGQGETTLTAEQVSHHPPITAYHLENAKLGVRLDGHSAQKTSFGGRSITVRQIGHAILRFTPDGEKDEHQYLITLPQLVIEGLLYGSPYIELQGTSYIQSSTGYLATINYSGRGWVSGKAHSFKATISPSAAPTNAFYSIEGEWAGVSNYKGKSPTGQTLFWDASTPRVELQVKPIEQQEAMESRKVWAVTAAGIRSGDYETASRDKSRIENEQRAKRKTEAANSTPHKLRFFAHEDDDATYSTLAAMFSGKPPKEDFYRFIG
ncbi:Oxysterol-binding protein 4 [Tilletia horrida]|nr:Oxysterol-binding protein 4 [Tilletia horrida]